MTSAERPGDPASTAATRLGEPVAVLWDHLVLPGGGQCELAEGLVVGRAPSAGLHLDDASVSRAHARITGSSGAWVLADLHSRNGTWVNDTRLLSGGAHPVRDGDTVRLGGLTMTVVLQGAEQESATTTMDGEVLSLRLSLTPYQLTVLRLLCETRDPDEPPSNAEIARRLGTPEAEDAVKAAFTRIYARAGLSGSSPGKRRELRRRAVRGGWLT